MEIIGSGGGGDSLPIGLVVSAPVGVEMDPAKWLRLSREAHAKADYPTLAEFLASQVNVPFQLQEVNQANSNDFTTMYAITRFNGFWIVLGRTSSFTTYTIYSSPDRVTWTRDMNSGSGQGINPCEYFSRGPARVLAIPFATGSAPPSYSDDGRTWIRAAAKIQASAGIATSTIINNARYLRDRHWVLSISGYVFHSQDGLAWTAAQMPGNNANLRAIAWDSVNDRFMVSGDAGRCFAWNGVNLAAAQELINPTTEAIFSMDHDGQAFYGIGSNGRKIRSVDGVNIVAGRFAPGIGTPSKIRWIQDKGIWLVAASSRDLDGRSAFMSTVDMESNTIDHLLIDNNPNATTIINDFHYDPAAGLVAGRGALLAASDIPAVNPATHFVTPAPSPYLSSGLVEYIKAA